MMWEVPAGRRKNGDPCVGCWGFRGLQPRPVLKVLAVLCAWAKGESRSQQPRAPESSTHPPSAPTQACPHSCPPIPRGPSQARAINVVSPSDRPDILRLCSSFLLLPIPKLLAPPSGCGGDGTSAREGPLEVRASTSTSVRPSVRVALLPCCRCGTCLTAPLPHWGSGSVGKWIFTELNAVFL